MKHGRVWGFSIFFLATVAGACADTPLHRGPVTGISFDGGEIYSCSQAGVFRGHGDSLKKICAPDFRVISVLASPDRLILAGGKPGESGILALFDSNSGENLTTKKITDDLIYSAATSGDLLFLALAKGGVCETGRFGAHPRHRHTATTRAVGVSPDGKFLASGGMDRVVIVSEIEKARTAITIQDHTAAVECLAFSPDSSQLASGARDGKVRIHAVPGGKLLRTYSNLEGGVSAIAWAGKPERLLAGTSTGRIYQLDLSNDSATLCADWGAESPITALAIDPKGTAYAGTLNRVDRVKLSN